MRTHTPLLFVFLLMGCSVTTQSENQPLILESNFSAALYEATENLPLRMGGDFLASTYDAFCDEPKLKNATIWYERRNGRCVPVVNTAL